MNAAAARRWNFWGGVITVATLVCAVLWAFPIYWGVISSLKPEDEVVRPYIELWPDTLTFQHYVFALTSTQIGIWYVNSVAVAVGVTVITCLSALLCGYAISQLRFPGRTALWWLILASFMVPIQALIIDHFVLIARLGLVNTWAGIILPQLIHPVIIIVYKQFFDQVPQGLPRGRGDGQRLQVRDPVQGLPADELGGDDRAVDRLLHLDLERLPLAVPRR